MTEAEELAWYRSWRRRVRSAYRLWLNATSFKNGCETLQGIKDVLNEQPPSPEKGSEEWPITRRNGRNAKKA